MNPTVHVGAVKAAFGVGRQGAKLGGEWEWDGDPERGGGSSISAPILSCLFHSLSVPLFQDPDKDKDTSVWLKGHFINITY